MFILAYRKLLDCSLSISYGSSIKVKKILAKNSVLRASKKKTTNNYLTKVI